MDANNATTTREVEPVLAVVSPNAPAASETFIRAHVDSMPVRTVLVHSWPPSVGQQVALSLAARAAFKVSRRLSGEGLQRETTAAYLNAFRRQRVTAVLAEYGPTGVLVMEACRRLGLPLIVHFHGYDASVRSVLAENAAAYRAMFQQAAATIAVSRAMQRKLVTLGALAERVHYNPCGVDCTQFTSASPQNSPPVFLAVGRFVQKKGPQLTLAAFARAFQSFPEMRLRMVGDGPLLEECRALAAELGINDAVTFLGVQPPKIVQAEMRSARCFVQHSVEAPDGDCEGTPVAVLEAGASGLPVVATRHAGIPDVVLENQTGLLVDERDVEGMGGLMLRIAADRALAARLGHAARVHVESHHSTLISNKRLWEIIESSTPGMRS